MSILEAIKQLKYTTPISEELKTLIQSKLVSIFTQLCPLCDTLTLEDFSFLASGIDSINMAFKYALVDIICKQEHIEVNFYFKVEKTIGIVPVGAETLFVITDEHMDYNSAIFKSAFTFGSPGLKGKLSIDRWVDRHFNVKTSLSYAISSYGLDSFRFNLKYEHLPKIYLSNDNNFYTPFLKMIEYCFNHPEIFYSVFDEYPSHKDMLSDDCAFKNFLRNYNNDYKSRKKLLKSKIILLDMQAI